MSNTGGSHVVSQLQQTKSELQFALNFVFNTFSFYFHTVQERQDLQCPQTNRQGNSPAVTHSVHGTFGGDIDASQMARFSIYLVHYVRPERNGPWSNVVHFIGNKVPFGTHFTVYIGHLEETLLQCRRQWAHSKLRQYCFVMQ